MAEGGNSSTLPVGTSMIDRLHDQREKNLRQMRSPASIALAICSIAAVVLASAFYDHPIMKAPQLVAALKHHITAQ
jgi:hypothetical protein